MTTKAGDERLESTSGGGRLYNPYADLHGALDGRSVGNIYKLPDAPEFLFTEEAEVQRRSWSDNLTYWTGGGYLTGAIVGGGRGLAEGLKGIEKTDTTKLRLNRILNASGLRGRQAGNMLGILGLLYAGSDSLITHYRGEDDMLNQIAAGLTTGTLYKAAAGPRTAVLAGAVGGATAALMAAAKQVTKRYGYSLL